MNQSIAEPHGMNMNQSSFRIPENPYESSAQKEIMNPNHVESQDMSMNQNGPENQEV